MKRFFVAMILGTVSCYPSSITLHDILSKSTMHNPMQEALLEDALAKEAQYKGDHAPEPFTLHGTSGEVKPEFDRHTKEYAIGVSKQIFINDSEALDNDIAHLQMKADTLDAEKKILNFDNGLKELYHKSCIQQENNDAVKKLYDEFETLYAKKEKAYTYGEISKVELFYLKIEKEKLLTQLKETEAMSTLSRETLYQLSGIPTAKDTVLACTDMYPIVGSLSFEDTLFALSSEAYKNRIQSTQKLITRNKNVLDAVDVSLEYTHEVGIEKYIVGVSIPLHLNDKQSEQKRLEALHQSNALEAKYRQNILERHTQLHGLQTELSYQSNVVNRMKKTIHEYQQTLLPLLQKSYAYGESSVTEYILSKQQYYALLQSFYTAQISYYHALFGLYTLSETKETL